MHIGSLSSSIRASITLQVDATGKNNFRIFSLQFGGGYVPRYTGRNDDLAEDQQEEM